MAERHLKPDFKSFFFTFQSRQCDHHSTQWSARCVEVRNLALLYSSVFFHTSRLAMFFICYALFSFFNQVSLAKVLIKYRFYIYILRMYILHTTTLIAFCVLQVFKVRLGIWVFYQWFCRNCELHGCRDGSVDIFKILNRKDKQTNNH